MKPCTFGANESINGSAQSQEWGGNTSKWTNIQVQLNRIVQGHHPISRTSLCSFVRGGTVEALPSPTV